MGAVVVQIGYGPSRHRKALPHTQRSDFRAKVRRLISAFGVLTGEVDGETYSEGWGQEASTWFSVSDLTPETIEVIKARLHDLALLYLCDQILVTEGMVEIIGPGRYNEFEEM